MFLRLTCGRGLEQRVVVETDDVHLVRLYTDGEVLCDVGVPSYYAESPDWLAVELGGDP